MFVFTGRVRGIAGIFQSGGGGGGGGGSHCVTPRVLTWSSAGVSPENGVCNYLALEKS